MAAMIVRPPAVTATRARRSARTRRRPARGRSRGRLAARGAGRGEGWGDGGMAGSGRILHEGRYLSRAASAVTMLAMSGR